MEDTQIRVAIIGGGLGGTVLMNSLMKHPHIDAQIYEAKDTFKERGASVGLACNAQKALDLLGLRNILDNTGAVPVNGARCFMGDGPDQGKLVLNLSLDLVTVHRANLLRELVDPIPPERLHVNKKVTEIIDHTITFADGSTVTADVIIGADGIHSCVRPYVVGDDQSQIAPVPAGIYDCRTVIPFETAVSKIGAEHLRPHEPRQTIYCGNDVILFFDYLDDGKSICIVAAGTMPTAWDRAQWKQSVSKEWLSERFQNWPEFAQEMINLLYGDEAEIPAFIEWESAPTTRIYNGTTCIMGDAAHATTPWQGAGLGQAIEDALVLQAVLADCKSVADVPAAFQAYDSLMRPRGRRVIESSRNMAKLLFGKEGLEAERIGELMAPMWDFIYQWDAEAALANVVNEARTLRTSAAVH